MQDRTSNTHRAKILDNSMMVDPIKGWAEINLHNPSLLPTPNALCSVWDTHKCPYTGTQTFRISKLGCWKHTIAFQKSPETTDTRRSNSLDNTGGYGNRSVIDNRGRRWTFLNLGHTGLSLASRKTSQTNKLPEYYTNKEHPLEGSAAVILGSHWCSRSRN